MAGANAEMHELLARWQELQLAAPPKPRGKPDTAEMAALKAHKERLKEFKAALSEAELIAVVRCDRDPASLEEFLGSGSGSGKAKGNSSASAKQSSDQPATLEGAGQSAVHKGLTLLPLEAPVSLIGGPAVSYHGVLPFYSHTIASKAVKRCDNALGIDRRVFSNLYPEELRLSGLQVSAKDECGIHIEPDVLRKLMRHEFLADADTKGCCSESFFQAAKMHLEADARFIIEYLDPLQAAQYGQGRLTLTADQRELLIACGVPADGIIAADRKGAVPDEGATVSWTRSPPRRDDWEEVKLSWMLYLLRCKFLVPSAETVDADTKTSLTKAQQTAAALADRSKSSRQHWLPVEHTRNDRKWGDGADGTGTNLLGRCIAQVLLEAAGIVAPFSLPVDATAIASVQNNKLVRYVRTGE